MTWSSLIRLSGRHDQQQLRHTYALKYNCTIRMNSSAIAFILFSVYCGCACECACTISLDFIEVARRHVFNTYVGSVVIVRACALAPYLWVLLGLCAHVRWHHTCGFCWGCARVCACISLASSAGSTECRSSEMIFASNAHSPAKT